VTQRVGADGDSAREEATDRDEVVGQRRVWRRIDQHADRAGAASHLTAIVFRLEHELGGGG
jgi:hypothetical protein